MWWRFHYRHHSTQNVVQTDGVNFQAAWEYGDVVDVNKLTYVPVESVGCVTAANAEQTTYTQ